ncbi:MAG TPA: hypothetical protein VH701_24195 [Vicinamibacterales bacterium]|jgi:hypothetical protein
MITQVDHERLLKRPRELSIAITFGCARRLRAKRKVGSRIFANWNQVDGWLRQVDGLRAATI